MKYAKVKDLITRPKVLDLKSKKVRHLPKSLLNDLWVVERPEVISDMFFNTVANNNQGYVCMFNDTELVFTETIVR